MKHPHLLLATAVVLVAVPSLLAQGCGGGLPGQPRAGCCPAPSAAPGSQDAHGPPAAPGVPDPHAAHRAGPATLTPNPNPTPKNIPALGEPAKSVLANYLRIQSALAQDSLRGVSESAGAIAQAVRADAGHMLPPQVAQQAENLGKAKDIVAVRQAFRPLSDSLIRYVKTGNLPVGTFYEVYCPMAKASWLQTDKTVRNPYYGQSMLNCGVIRAG